MRTLYWEDGKLYLLDQTLLPWEEKYVACTDYRQAVAAIREMQVRGAPAIGVAAAYAVAMAGQQRLRGEDVSPDQVLADLTASRPTAVNLFWALERMQRCWEKAMGLGLAEQAHVLLAEAERIHREDLEANRAIGRYGAELVPPGASVLTICNAGSLATSGYGTALGVVRAAADRGLCVWACETRPRLQGARLTTWELQQDDIPVTLITDNMAGYLMQQGRVDLVITGADRIAANGDVANKIGTYSLAVLAAYHRLPFYVAAPLSTFDRTAASAEDIPIEERNPEEVRRVGREALVPATIPVYNPAFDPTPAALVTAFITERGVIYPPYPEKLAQVLS
ncbi:MAG: S-methyl-5-thioribose-1-phosphate isomerase [Clostridia bacterium]|nr:MAG: S-methyl-5-thioribose-1-phosphate isomerase [Clostridia bacterium]